MVGKAPVLKNKPEEEEEFPSVLLGVVVVIVIAVEEAREGRIGRGGEWEWCSVACFMSSTLFSSLSETRRGTAIGAGSVIDNSVVESFEEEREEESEEILRGRFP